MSVLVTLCCSEGKHETIQEMKGDGSALVTHPPPAMITVIQILNERKLGMRDNQNYLEQMICSVCVLQYIFNHHTWSAIKIPWITWVYIDIALRGYKPD